MATRKKKTGSKEVALPWKQQLAKFSKNGKAPKEKPAQGDSISLKGGKFSLGDHNLGRELDCVILAWNFENSYFDSPYVEGEAQSPACFALSYDEDELAPHADSPVPQCDNCAECEHNEWGSANVGEGKACGNRRRLILAVEGKDGKVEIKTLRLPSTSLRNWKGFVSELETHGLETMQCAVNIHFDEDSTASFPPLCFEFVSEITKEATLQAMAGMLEEAHRLLEQPYDANNYSKPGRSKKKAKKKAGKKKASKKRRSKFS